MAFISRSVPEAVKSRASSSAPTGVGVGVEEEKGAVYKKQSAGKKLAEMAEIYLEAGKTRLVLNKKRISSLRIQRTIDKQNGQKIAIFWGKKTGRF